MKRIIDIERDTRVAVATTASWTNAYDLPPMVYNTTIFIAFLELERKLSNRQ